MKQTAVEWVEEKLKENLKHIVINNDHVLIESFFLQAKEMEKQQIIDAQSYAVSHADMTNNKGYFDCEQYYKETYKQD